MANVLAISSQVVRGHVGNSAAVFALQRLGHEVWAVPAVLLSNHPGHAHTAGSSTQPDTIRKILAALQDNGWFGEIDAVLTGYLPTPGHVEIVAETIALLRSNGRKLVVLVDPVLGDDPAGLYIAQAAAAAVRSLLLPLADVLTPNRFELAWLSGQTVTNAASAAVASAQLGIPAVIATSIPAPHGLVNLLWRADGQSGVEVPRLNAVPHGTGDFLAALHLGHMLNGDAMHVALQRAVAGVAAAIAASAGADELQIVRSQEIWALRKTVA